MKQTKKEKRKRNYQLCWEHLKESMGYFLAIILILVLSSLIGWFYPVLLQEYISKFIQQLADKTKDMGFFELFAFIFQNNITTAFLGIIFGLFFGIFPLLASFFNGYVLGFVAEKATNTSGFQVLLKLLPHGVFEIPALIISLGLGLKLGLFIFVNNKKKQIVYDLKESLRVFVYVILPLLLIAAVIETSLIFLWK